MILLDSTFPPIHFFECGLADSTFPPIHLFECGLEALVTRNSNHEGLLRCCLSRFLLINFHIEREDII